MKNYLKKLDFVLVLVAFLGLVVGTNLVQQKQLFNQNAKTVKGVKKTIYLDTGNLKKIGQNTYDLGEKTNPKGRKLRGTLIVDDGGPENSTGNFEGKVEGVSTSLSTSSQVLQSSTSANCMDQELLGAFTQESAQSYVYDPTNASGLNPVTTSQIIDDAVIKWEDAAGADIMGDQTVGLLSKPSSINISDGVDANGVNEIYFADSWIIDPNDPHGSIIPSPAFAITINWRGADGKAVETDIVINDLYSWEANGDPNYYDFDTIITHELGHAAGLADVYDTNCTDIIMYGKFGKGELRRDLTIDDETGVFDLYNPASCNLGDSCLWNAPNGQQCAGVCSGILNYCVDTIGDNCPAQSEPGVSESYALPLGDSFVNSVYPNRNYGSNSTITVDGSPTKSAYLKFDLRNYKDQTVNKALLTFRVTNSTSSPQVISRALSAWNETKITYNDQPITAETVAMFDKASSGTWNTVDITNFVNVYKGKLVTLKISSSGSNNLAFYSDNSSSSKPYIDIVVGGDITITPTVTPTPTPVPTSTSTPATTRTKDIVISEDSYIYQNYPETNYGGRTVVWTDGSPVRKMFLKFDLSSLSGASVKSAKLVARVYDSSKATQNVEAVSNSWNESSLTWNNAPPAGSLITTLTGTSTSIPMELDLTNYIKNNVGKTVSVMIEETSSDGLGIYSKESPSGEPPKLVVEY